VPRDGSVSSDAARVPGPSTCECASGQVCVDGSCAAVPESCPCPRESYCDIGADRCVVGCLGDGDCAAGRICIAASRTCTAGCRDDAACGTGRICEGLQCRDGCREDRECGAGRICDLLVCRAGCRSDGDCASGEVCDRGAQTCSAGCTADTDCGAREICESLRCRAGCREDVDCGEGQICRSSACGAGCRSDADCGPSATCRASMSSCASCDGDPDEIGDSTITTSGRSVSESVVRVLCGASDRDTLRWTASVDPGYYRTTMSVEVAGADEGATTTITLAISGHEESHAIVGSGFLSLYDESYDYYCFEGRCAVSTWTLSATTTSESPATIELRVSVRPTRG
jgi:Cys-rich repeat protein